MSQIRTQIGPRRRRSPTVIGYLACAWALLFAVAHVYWAVGGPIGLQGNEMTGLLLAINVVAIPLCLAAAGAACGVTLAWDRIVPHRMWFLGAAGAAVLLSLRGIVGLFQGIIVQEEVSLLLVGYDSWFLLGGILFCLVVVGSARSVHSR